MTNMAFMVAAMFTMFNSNHVLGANVVDSLNVCKYMFIYFFFSSFSF